MTVYYDGTCPICTAAAQGWSAQAERADVALLPLQEAPPAAEGPSKAELMQAIHVREGGTWLRGARALRAVYRRLDNRPMTALLSLGIALRIADPLYNLVARNRMHLPLRPRPHRPR